MNKKRESETWNWKKNYYKLLNGKQQNFNIPAHNSQAEYKKYERNKIHTFYMGQFSFLIDFK